MIRTPIAYFMPITQMAILQYTDIQLCIEHGENYQKRSIRNRCLLLSDKGITTLSVPLEKGKNASLSINQVKISYAVDWVAQHKKALLYYYQNAPFFEYYIDDINHLLDQKPNTLIELNTLSLDLLRAKMDISASPFISNVYQPNDLKLLEAYEKTLIENPKHIYNQVYDDKLNFIAGLSALDLLFNQGPESKKILQAYGDDFIRWYRLKNI